MGKDVGAGLGLRVGSCVGKGVGCDVGSGLGLRVGSCVGKGVGRIDVGDGDDCVGEKV